MRIEARVDRVTVFERGAKVTRLARLPSPAPRELIITGLPLGLLDDTVRVSARGAKVQTATVALDSPGPSDELPSFPSAEAESAKLACELASAEVERLERELASAERATLLVAPPESEAPAEPSKVMAARRTLAALRQRRLAALRRAHVEAKRTLDQRVRARLAAEERDARASSARSPRQLELRKAVQVTLVSEAAEPAEPGAEIALELEYGVLGARWVPSYVARLEENGLELTARASLMQRTGEDWTGVALELSTAAMSRPSALPELTSLRLGRQQPPPAKRHRPPPQGVAELFADYQRDLRDLHDLHDLHDAPPPPPKPEPAPEPEPFEDLEQLDDRITLEINEPMYERSRRFQTRGGGGAVPPAPAPMLAAPAGPGAPQRAMAAKRFTMAAFDSSLELGGAAPAEAPPPPPPPLAQLDYFGLRMAGPEDSARGQLTLMTLLARYQCDGLEASLLIASLQASERAAAEVDRAPTPAGTSDRWSHTFDYALAADGRIDLPADGAWHSIALGTRRTTARLHHLAVPREQADVFRRATAPNPFLGPLLPGPVDVYDRARFLLTARLELVAPGGELELPLGADSTVKIARNCRYHEEVSGVLRGGLRLVHEVTIDVQNLSAAAIELEVRERVPVVPEDQRDDITVKVTACRPPWQPWSPQPKHPGEPKLRGGYTWTLPVAPRSKAQLTASYEIAIAGKHELVGGNRREP